MTIHLSCVTSEPFLFAMGDWVMVDVTSALYWGNCVTTMSKILSVMFLSSRWHYELGYRQLILLAAFITVNTNVKTCIPQVSGLSKPDIITQIEDMLHIVSLLMMHPSIMLIAWSICYSILMRDKASYFHSACRTIYKGSKCKGWHFNVSCTIFIPNHMFDLPNICSDIFGSQVELAHMHSKNVITTVSILHNLFLICILVMTFHAFHRNTFKYFQSRIHHLVWN